MLNWDQYFHNLLTYNWSFQFLHIQPLYHNSFSLNHSDPRHLRTAWHPPHPLVKTSSFDSQKISLSFSSKMARDEIDSHLSWMNSFHSSRDSCHGRIVTSWHDRHWTASFAVLLPLSLHRICIHTMTSSNRNTAWENILNESLTPLHGTYHCPKHSFSLQFLFYKTQKRQN